MALAFTPVDTWDDVKRIPSRRRHPFKALLGWTAFPATTMFFILARR
jgi:hypothetical protein